MNNPNTYPENVWLQAPTPDDAPELFERIDANRGPLSKFWWVHETHDVEDSRQFIERTLAEERAGTALSRLIMTHEVETDRDRIVGVGGIHSIHGGTGQEHGTGELGMWIDQAESGKGIGTTAESLLIRLAFDELELDELRISTRESNKASRRIAEKLGFMLIRVDHQPTWKTDEHVSVAKYSLSRDRHLAQTAVN